MSLIYMRSSESKTLLDSIETVIIEGFRVPFVVAVVGACYTFGAVFGSVNAAVQQVKHAKYHYKKIDHSWGQGIFWYCNAIFPLRPLKE